MHNGHVALHFTNIRSSPFVLTEDFFDATLVIENAAHHAYFTQYCKQVVSSRTDLSVQASSIASLLTSWHSRDTVNSLLQLASAFNTPTTLESLVKGGNPLMCTSFYQWSWLDLIRRFRSSSICIGILSASMFMGSDTARRLVVAALTDQPMDQRYI